MTSVFRILNESSRMGGAGRTMKIDFKKELETASRGMIMIHDPKLLIRLIVRMLVRKLKIRHAAMVLYDPDRDEYVLSISRGERGLKIPTGFTRFSKTSPIIRLFSSKEYRPLLVERSALVNDDINHMIWRESVVEHVNGSELRELLHKVNAQMHMLNCEVSVPAYYSDKLMAVLLLGQKEDGRKFDQDELDFFAALASDAAMAIRNAHLFTGLKREAERNRRQFLQTIVVLGSTIEAKDAYTHGHTERVTRYAMSIARQMQAMGLETFSENFFENLYIAGLLHDIGKIAVPESILNKPGALTTEEYLTMKQHTIRGAEMVKPLDLPQECIDGIRHHHETYNGLGYPDGLRGAEIPLSSAILAVADAFDAMTTDRPYRKGMSQATAIEEIDLKTGIQFAPLPARAMVELFHKGVL